MTRRFTFLVFLLAIALAVPALVSAQAKADFSGKWVQDMEKSDQPMGGGGGRGPAGPQNITITQTATEITIERVTGQGSQKTVYKLDGSDSVNAMGRGGEVTSKTTWDGNKLVTKYSQTMGEATMQITETRSLEADGTLTVVRAMTGGPQGDMTRKVVFKKG